MTYYATKEERKKVLAELLKLPIIEFPAVVVTIYCQLITKRKVSSFDLEKAKAFIASSKYTEGRK